MIKKTKEQKAITLIALVITIIILLILAGVVLTMVFNGGIIDKSQKAVDKTRVESFKEEATIAMIGRKIEKEGTLEESLTAAITGNKTVEAAENVDDVCYVTRNGDTITVYENGDVVEGRVSIWNGTTKAVPEIKQENGKFNWYIYTAEELKFLADYVNNARQLNEDLTSKLSARNYSASDVVMDENTTVYLMNNIDLGAREGEGATIEAKWETTANEAKKWEPIGIDNSTKKMIATFEGNNHTISGVYVNQSTDCAGIFGNSYTVNDLTIKDSYVKGVLRVGGIVGTLNSESVNNCHNINTKVSGTERVGGVAGNIDISALSVTNCSNSGNVKGQGSRVGGVVGNFAGTNMVSYCNNSGTVTGGDSVGGVAGYVYTSATVTSCRNNGSIIGSGNYVGGVVGYAGKSVTLTGCNNSGAVTGSGDRVGGIVGHANTSATVTSCRNNGSIIGSGNYVGGVAGNASKSATVTECNNSGEVTGSGDNVGGIAGCAYTSATVTVCDNSGMVTGSGDYVGGIAGIAGYIVTKCSNTGNVIGNGTKGTGGIVGDSISGYGQDISLCYNSGEVRGAGQVGGISGYLGSAGANLTGKEDKCYNKGRVINTGTTGIAGGVVGSMAADANVTKCFYLNTIGVERGVYSIGSGGNLDLQNQGAAAVSDDLTYEQFKTWIETK